MGRAQLAAESDSGEHGGVSRAEPHIIDMQSNLTIPAAAAALKCCGTRSTMIFSQTASGPARRGIRDQALGGRDQAVHSLRGRVHRAPMMTLAVLCSMGWSRMRHRT
jgi:hypothetical protein